jgi:hypothetical protein
VEVVEARVEGLGEMVEGSESMQVDAEAASLGLLKNDCAIITFLFMPLGDVVLAFYTEACESSLMVFRCINQG